MARKDGSRVPGQPLAGRNPFFVYLLAQQMNVRKAHPEWDRKRFMKELGAMWEALPPEEKAVYKTKSKDDHERARKELEAFRRLPPMPATARMLFFEERLPVIKADYFQAKALAMGLKDARLAAANEWDGLTPRMRTDWQQKSDARQLRWNSYVHKHGDPIVYLGNGTPIRYSLFMKSAKSNGIPHVGRPKKDVAVDSEHDYLDDDNPDDDLDDVLSQPHSPNPTLSHARTSTPPSTPPVIDVVDRSPTWNSKRARAKRTGTVETLWLVESDEDVQPADVGADSEAEMDDDMETTDDELYSAAETSESGDDSETDNDEDMY